MSWPYKQSPASSLRVSLAPRPTRLDPLSINFSVKITESSFGKDISNPSSPV